ncbi:unnamed protein product [Urochloa humidicola]
MTREASARDCSAALGDSPGDASRAADDSPIAAVEYPRLASTSPPLLANPAELAPRFVPIGATVPLPIQGLRRWRTRAPPAHQRRPPGPRPTPVWVPKEQTRGRWPISQRRRRRAAPGVSFSELLLSRFFCLNAPARNWELSNCSTLIWIVPIPPLSTDPDHRVVGNALDFNFSVPPSRFLVRPAGPGIFVTAAASSTVAHFIILQGWCSSGSLHLALFPRLSLAESFLAGPAASGGAAARPPAELFKIQIPAFRGGFRFGPPAHAGNTGGQSTVPVSSIPTALTISCTPPVTSDSSARQLGEQSGQLACDGAHVSSPPSTRFSLGGVGTPSDHSTEAAMSTPYLSAPSAAQSPQPSHTRAAHPYLLAFLSSPPGLFSRAVQPRLRRAISLPPAKTQCFRCLGTDHLVAQCREPVRCRHCLRFGHRSPTCPRLATLGGSTPPLTQGANSTPAGRLPALVITELPTQVRPCTPTLVSFDSNGVVEQDIIPLGTREARLQPCSSLPSLEDLLAEEEHVVSVRRRRARRKRIVDSACKRRSRRLAEKEPAQYVSATAKATSIKAAKLDMTGASSSMAAAIEASGILQRPPPRRTAVHHLRRLGAACGINDLSALEECEEPAVA